MAEFKPESIVNFRDCGGCHSKDGRAMRTARLYRSGQLSFATSADLQQIASLGVRTVIDLRRKAERGEHVAPWPHDTLIETVCRDDGDHCLPPHLDAFVEAGGSVNAARSAMLRIYRAIPFDPLIIDLTRTLVDRLCQSEAAILVHCAAGKDRTGFVVALIHILLEIDPEELRKHYFLSHQACLADAHSFKRMQEALAKPGRSPKDEAIRVVLSAYPEFLDSAFQSIHKRTGSIERYIRDSVGISPTMHGDLKDKLLC